MYVYVGEIQYHLVSLISCWMREKHLRNSIVLPGFIGYFGLLIWDILFIDSVFVTEMHL